MLCDPFKYQDYVNKFLDGIEEEEDYKTNGGMPMRKRTRSSTYLSRPNPSHILPEINEEDYEHQNVENCASI